jgi:hypothetical protein
MPKLRVSDHEFIDALRAVLGLGPLNGDGRPDPDRFMPDALAPGLGERALVEGKPRHRYVGAD